MFTLSCHFHFPDGAVALATLSVSDPTDDGEVQYAGASDRLPDRPQLTEVSVLKIWAVRVANQAKAVLTITEAGQYDTWAE